MNEKEIIEITDYLDSFIDKELITFDIPGMSVAVVKGTEIVWQKGFGWQNSIERKPTSSNTVFRVGSISKLFNAVAVMQLHEKGILNIDVPITEYCSELTFKNKFESTAPITLRHLLSHRAGILRESPVGNYFDDGEPSIEETVHSIIDTDLIYEVGQNCKYSNLGPTISGYIIEKVTGVSFPEYVKEHILTPLEMNSSSFLFDNQMVQENLATSFMVNFDNELFQAPTFQLGTIPAGNLYSTSSDLANFMICMMNKGEFRGKRVILEGTLQEMQSLQFDSNNGIRNFGLGFSLGKLGEYHSFSHTGIVYGFTSDFYALKEPQLGVIILNTVDGAVGINTKIRNEILGKFLSAFGFHEYLKRTIRYENNCRHEPEIPGKYESDSHIAWAWKSNDRYYIQTMGITKRLKSIGHNSFITDDRLDCGLPVRFEKNKDTLNFMMKAGNIFYKKVGTYPPDDSIPQKYEKYIGDYGKDYNILRIFVRDNRLHCIIEWFYEYPLKQISEKIFVFPDYGLYEGESIEFKENTSGEITEAVAGFVHFKRKDI